MVPQTVGTLKATPFGELLVQAHDRRLTGTLVFEEAGGARHGVYLEAGAPQKAKIGGAGIHLGEVLVETGAISAEVHERTLERALRERVLFGQLLLGEGRISEASLALGLREHLDRQLVWLFGQPSETHYGLFEGKNLLARWGGAEKLAPRPLELLWRGLCAHLPDEAVDGALARVEGMRLALERELDPDHFAFMGDASRIVLLFRGAPRRLGEIVASEPFGEAEVRRVLYFLLLTRSLDLGIPSAPPVGLDVEPFSAPPAARVPSLASEPPSGTPARHDSADPAPSRRRDSPASIPPGVVRSAALRDELRRRLEKPPRTHYETLGIPEDAPLRQVQAAFFLLSKHWHPDRLGPEAADLKDGAAHVFDGIAKAYRVLSDPAARAGYDDELSEGKAQGSAPLLERALTADVAFHKAEQFLARGNLEAAEREARVALDNEPARAEYIALVAWLDALKPSADERQLNVVFTKALRAGQGSIKVHWYRGLFLKRTGRHASALQEFRFVSERDPRHIDAAREVRIYEQRLHNSPKDRPSLAPEAPHSERSPWSRLFKRRS